LRGGYIVPVFDLYSYRKRRNDGRTPDVFSYDRFPESLRVQIIHIWRDAIGPFYVYGPRDFAKATENNEGWGMIHDIVAREHSKFSLSQRYETNRSCEEYLLSNSSTEAALDITEVSFLYIDRVVRQMHEQERRSRGIKVSADDAIEELNERFMRAGVGYRFESGRIVRVDSELIHSEVVRPALLYLGRKGFEGPHEEFISAHAHYRAGEMKEAITDANNAFESTLKSICLQRRWKYPNGARASDLLKIVRKHGLLPDYLDRSFDQLAATLKSGLPEVRNMEAAHGQGARPRVTPAYVAGYALHLAATNILFLVEAHLAPK